MLTLTQSAFLSLPRRSSKLLILVYDTEVLLYFITRLLSDLCNIVNQSHDKNLTFWRENSRKLQFIPGNDGRINQK